jgi:transposase
LDDAGRALSEWRGPNSELGWRRFQQWAHALGTERRIGIEGAWGYGRGLAQHLVAAGEMVHEVNPRWTAQGRRSARRPEKSDRQDARAVALFIQREAPSLPAISAEDETALLDLLATEREAAVVESTRLRNRLHALLLQLDPEYQLRMPPLRTKAGRAVLRAYEAPDERPISLERAAAVRRLAARLELVATQAEVVADRIRELAEPRFTPLTELHGVSLLTAGTIAGILGPRRFRSDAALAAFAAACPLEACPLGRCAIGSTAEATGG